MDCPVHFGWKSVNNYLSANLPNQERILFRFYPEIRWKGRRVHVWNGWDPNSSEPMLQCLLDLGELGAASASDAEVKVQELIEEGWSWNWREGGLKYIHVNDLEKIEGPPPEGPF